MTRYAIEFTDEENRFDMPYLQLVSAKNKSEAKTKFFNHYKKRFPKQEIMISNIYIDTIKRTKKAYILR
jgi:hypothetical protein